MSQRIDRACLNCSVLLHYSSICYESGGLSSGIFFLPHVWPLSFKASRAITQLHVLTASWEEEKENRAKTNTANWTFFPSPSAYCTSLFVSVVLALFQIFFSFLNMILDTWNTKARQPVPTYRFNTHTDAQTCEQMAADDCDFPGRAV